MSLLLFIRTNLRIVGIPGVGRQKQSIVTDKKRPVLKQSMDIRSKAYKLKLRIVVNIHIVLPLTWPNE